MTVSRRDFALAGLGLALTPAALSLASPALAQSNLSAEDQAALERVQAYFQGMESVQGDFAETGPNGQRRSGRFYIQRPGRMRFEYTNPEGLLVVSDGHNVKRWDPRLETFQQVPLGQTPLSTFLARNVRISEGVRIDRVTPAQGGAFAVTARDSRRPNEGQVILSFAGSPMRLQEWMIIDAQGQRTRTQLTSLQPASGLASSLFQLRDPRPQRGPRR